MLDDRMLTGMQLATFLQCSARTVRRLAAEGVLRRYKIRAHAGFRYLLSEVLEDLGRAESDIPLHVRKAPRVRTRTKRLDYEEVNESESEPELERE